MFNYKTRLMLACVYLASPFTAAPVDTPVDPGLNKLLQSSTTALDAQAQLESNGSWVFDFFAHEYHTASPGGVVNANAALFPATVGHGLTMAWITLGPCAMLPPHYHPRAANIITAVEGQTQTHMVLENGAQVVSTLLNPGKVTILPAASVHTMQNVGCGNATLISALNSEDAGTHNIANALINLPEEMTRAAFGNKIDQDGYKQLANGVPAVGTGASMGSAKCLAKCKLDSRSQCQRA